MKWIIINNGLNSREGSSLFGSEWNSSVGDYEICSVGILQKRCSVEAIVKTHWNFLFLEANIKTHFEHCIFNMAPNFIYNLSGDEIGKECTKLGLSGRFTMKEALVELSLALAKSGIDPKTHQFYPSQPLIGFFPYQVVILTDIIETTRALPITIKAGLFLSSSSSLLASSTGVTSSLPAQGPLCSTTPFFSPPFPPPVSPNTPVVNTSNASVVDNQVLGKILTTVEKMILERSGKPAYQQEQNGHSDSDSEFFSGSSSLSGTSSMASEKSSSSSTSFGSQSSTYWSKSKLREERICIKF